MPWSPQPTQALLLMLLLPMLILRLLKLRARTPMAVLLLTSLAVPAMAKLSVKLCFAPKSKWTFSVQCPGEA